NPRRSRSTVPQKWVFPYTGSPSLGGNCRGLERCPHTALIFSARFFLILHTRQFHQSQACGAGARRAPVQPTLPLLPLNPEPGSLFPTALLQTLSLSVSSLLPWFLPALCSPQRGATVLNVVVTMPVPAGLDDREA
ncbi:unnamed protein product, partial [Discosporangium mesarthrocarpum]